MRVELTVDGWCVLSGADGERDGDGSRDGSARRIAGPFVTMQAAEDWLDVHENKKCGVDHEPGARGASHETT